MVHTHMKPETFSTKEAFNKDFGESMMGCLDTYGEQPASAPSAVLMLILV